MFGVSLLFLLSDEGVMGLGSCLSCSLQSVAAAAESVFVVPDGSIVMESALMHDGPGHGPIVIAVGSVAVLLLLLSVVVVVIVSVVLSLLLFLLVSLGDGMTSRLWSVAALDDAAFVVPDGLVTVAVVEPAVVECPVSAGGLVVGGTGGISVAGGGGGGGLKGAASGRVGLVNGCASGGPGGR